VKRKKRKGKRDPFGSGLLSKAAEPSRTSAGVKGGEGGGRKREEGCLQVFLFFFPRPWQKREGRGKKGGGRGGFSISLLFLLFIFAQMEGGEKRGGKEEITHTFLFNLPFFWW